MQDVLSLVGATEFPSDSLAIAQISGLQSQLNAKASLQALSLASEAIGAELDGVETQVSAIGATVSSLGSVVATKASQAALDAIQVELDTSNEIRVGMQASIASTAALLVYAQEDLAQLSATTVASSALDAVNAAVDTKAAQSGLDATNASLSALSGNLNAVASSLTSNLNNVSTLLGTRASQASVTASLALKQDLIGESLALGALVIDATSDDVALFKHNEGVALQTAAGLTYGVFSPVSTTLRKLIVQEEIVLPNDSIQLVKVTGLTAALTGKASTEDLTSLVTLVNGKQDAIDDTLSFGLYRISTAGSSFSIQRLIDGVYSPIMNLQYNNGISRMSVFGELRPTSINGLSNLDILDTITATHKC
jgi:hypothetical protein